MKKRVRLIILIAIVIGIILTCVAFAANKIDISMKKETDNTVLLEINAEKNIKKVRVYLKRNSDEYQLFYQSGDVNKNNKTYRIKENRLSTESETYFKVIVIDEECNEESKEFKTGKIEVQPSQTPTPTPSQSASPSPSQSATPTPSQSTSPTQSPRPTSTPSPSTSTTPSPTNGNQEVTGIKLDNTSVKLAIGKTKTLKATITPKNATTKLTWSTSNNKVATISSTGKITAKKPGEAVITVKTTNGKTAQCKIKVILSVPSSTRGKNKNGDGYSKVITMGNRTFKLYKQNKGSYSQKPFNSTNNRRMQTIANTGCGPSSLAIILSGYGYNKNPYDIGKLLLKNSRPSGLPSMEKEAKGLGMKVIKHDYSKNYDKTYKEMKDALESGHQILLYVGKKSPSQYWKHFTNSGYHFVSILGIDSSNDKVYVGNPGLSGGWYKLSTVAKARGNTNGNMAGWLEIYK